MAKFILMPSIQVGRNGAVSARQDLSLDPISKIITANNSVMKNVADAVDVTDAPNLLQVQTAIQEAVDGLTSKKSVRVATTGNIDLASPPADIDGVTIAEGDRVLVKDQTTASENGIYELSGGALVRTSDANIADELVSAYFFVNEGTEADNGFTCINDAGFTLGTDDVIFAQRGSSTVPDATDTLAGKVRLANASEITAKAGSGITTVDNVKSLVDAGLGDYLPLSGGTMTGDITLDSGTIKSAGVSQLRMASGNNVEMRVRHNTNQNSFVQVEHNGSTSGRVMMGAKSGTSNNSLYATLTPNTFSLDGGSAFAGVMYVDDYSANFVDRSVPDVGWVKSQITASATKYSKTIAHGDLTAGSITVTHNLNKALPETFIAYHQGEMVFVPMQPVDANTATLDLSAFGDFSADGDFTVIFG